MVGCEICNDTEKAAHSFVEGTCVCGAREITEPVELFDAGSYLKRPATEECHNVTDGPFLYRLQSGRLIMVWSTSTDRYLQCVFAFRLLSQSRTVGTPVLMT